MNKPRPQAAPREIPPLTATVAIVPVGARGSAVRDHLIEVAISAGGGLDDLSELATLARRSLDAIPPAPGSPDRRRFSGGDASVVCSGRPAQESVEELRRVLAGARCKITIREKCECSEPGCASEGTIEWNH